MERRARFCRASTCQAATTERRRATELPSACRRVRQRRDRTTACSGGTTRTEPPGVPRDTYWTWGLYDSLIVVMPALDIVVARAGESWKRDQRRGPLRRVETVPRGRSWPPSQFDAGPRAGRRSSAAPYPPSPVIPAFDWAPPDTILRRAKGSDNWPMTWADDDWLYTAYGDGNGFEPLLKGKLSLGLARVRGKPPQIRAKTCVPHRWRRRATAPAARKPAAC